MYTLSVNIWFQKLMKQFFFGIDQVVYGAISWIYDLLISIARTSVLSQADILDMADRIYKLLAIFMIFKVTLSLITYVVNPDDFSDKSKGISKLVTNIVISLGLLILTPYIFNMAYRLQTIILEDNTLATLIFDESDSQKEENAGDFINTAGDEIAFITMSAFFTPNTSVNEFQNCIDLTTQDGKVNPECSGLNSNLSIDTTLSDTSGGQSGSMATLTTGDGGDFPLVALQNYVLGVENKNFGMMFRTEMALATVSDSKNNSNKYFVMEYRYVFSTVVGVVVVLLLISFCMDVALRSIKLAFLQLIAPIPILSYVDPKSGKDGMFKKWYQLCFKTYLSLFIRLLALYFAIYIISRIDNMVDIIDGSYQSNILIKIFIIIGALMFAKDLPKILEGLGIKLDGDGKFFLNPLKKFEESTVGGKNITGMARGAMVGTAGVLSGAGIGRGLSGAWRGLTSGKGWKETGKAEAEMNRKMRQARLDGSTLGGRLGARFAGSMGLPTSSESVEGQIHGIDERIKERQNIVKNLELERDAKKADYKESARKAGIMTKSMGDAKTTFIEKMKEGVGDTGAKYISALETRDLIADKLGQHMTWTDADGNSHDKEVTQEDIIAANSRLRDLEQNGWKDLIDEQIANSDLDAKLQTKLDVVYQDYATANGISIEEAKVVINSGRSLNSTLGSQVGVSNRAEAKQREIDEEYYDRIKVNNDNIAELEENKRQLYEQGRTAKANESVVK